MCVQTISTDADCLFFDYLDNCNESKIYPPLRLYDLEDFIVVNGRDARQISIAKVDFEVVLDGVTYTDKDVFLPIMLLKIGCVNASIIGDIKVVELNIPILTSVAAGWVIRTLSVAPNTVVQVKVVVLAQGQQTRAIGVKNTNSAQIFPDIESRGTVIYTVTADSNSQIHIYSSGSSVFFTELNKMEIG